MTQIMITADARTYLCVTVEGVTIVGVTTVQVTIVGVCGKHSTFYWVTKECENFNTTRSYVKFECYFPVFNKQM